MSYPKNGQRSNSVQQDSPVFRALMIWGDKLVHRSNGKQILFDVSAFSIWAFIGLSINCLSNFMFRLNIIDNKNLLSTFCLSKKAGTFDSLSAVSSWDQLSEINADKMRLETDHTPYQAVFAESKQTTKSLKEKTLGLVDNSNWQRGLDCPGRNNSLKFTKNAQVIVRG